MQIEVKPSGFKPGTKSVFIEIENLSEESYIELQKWFEIELNQLKDNNKSVSDMVAEFLIKSIQLAPEANPSDLWQHVVYRTVLEKGFSDQQWKRISGFSLEKAIVKIYQQKFLDNDLIIRILPKEDAVRIIGELGLQGHVKDAKIDCIIEKNTGTTTQLLACLHVKASLAERIQDDVPASIAIMGKNILSIMLTMDSKSFPPPHGNGINYGELGGRGKTTDKDNLIKRQYIEVNGQFDALFSFNLRTPPSAETTKSGKRIFTQLMSPTEDDYFFDFIKQQSELM